jgi:hypothetical protein
MTERHWLVGRSVRRELPPAALRAERQELAAAVRPKAPVLGYRGELVHAALALGTANRWVIDERTQRPAF